MYAEIITSFKGLMSRIQLENVGEPLIYNIRKINLVRPISITVTTNTQHSLTLIERFPGHDSNCFTYQTLSSLLNNKQEQHTCQPLYKLLWVTRDTTTNRNHLGLLYAQQTLLEDGWVILHYPREKIEKCIRAVFQYFNFSVKCKCLTRNNKNKSYHHLNTAFLIK